jgi:hypothetical protein
VSSSPSAGRVGRTALVCGLCGFVATALLHIPVRSMMRSLSPFDVDGTVASFCGQLLAAGISLFLTRTVRRNWLLWVSHFATVPLAAVAACLMGFGGLVAADSLRQIGFTFGRIELIPNDDDHRRLRHRSHSRDDSRSAQPLLVLQGDAWRSFVAQLRHAERRVGRCSSVAVIFGRLHSMVP